MTDLLLKQLSSGYGKEKVISNISFAIPRGQLCAVVGQNGSGKSTLLRAICGLLPYSGSCLAAGKEIAALSPRQKAADIGYLSQESETMKGISCLDMVLLGFYSQLGAFKKPCEKQKTAALSQMQELGILGLAQRDFAAVSTGQRQLVRIARTIVTHTRLLILDEADAALDIQHQSQVLSVLKRRVKSENSAALVVSHDINAMLRHADRLLLMNGGELSGDVLCTAENAFEVQCALQKLYGNIEVFSHNGHLMMGEAQ